MNEEFGKIMVPLSALIPNWLSYILVIAAGVVLLIVGRRLFVRKDKRAWVWACCIVGSIACIVGIYSLILNLMFLNDVQIYFG